MLFQTNKQKLLVTLCVCAIIGAGVIALMYFSNHT